MKNDFYPALPHGPLEEVLPGVFVVTGQFRMGPGGLVTFPRNMTVLKEGRNLTVINAVRLTDAGERALEGIGRVGHVVRLGAFHGIDDAYYLSRYKPAFWIADGARNPVSPPANNVDRHNLIDGLEPVFVADATFYTFRNARFPEAVILLSRGRGALIVCDSMGNVGSMEGFSRLARLFKRMDGPAVPCGLGRYWLKQMTLKGGPSLEADYRRLLSLPFESVIPAHGSVLKSGAKMALQRVVDMEWPPAVTLGAESPRGET